MTTRRATAGLVVLLFVISGCNSKLIRPPAIVWADAGNRIIETVIEVGDKNREFRFPSVFNAFLPSRVPLHPGDALNFEIRDSGEPHTVAMGTLVADAVTALETSGEQVDLNKIEKIKQMKPVPSVFPTKFGTGVPTLNRSATERCFLATGTPAVSAEGGAEACPEVDQPEFDGKQAFYSSGILEDGEPFRVKLSDDIVPGNYAFMCLVHRSQMTGAIEVRDTEVERPAVAELRTQAEREEESIDSVLEPPMRAAQTDALRVEGTPLYAGMGPEGVTRGEIDAFIPRDATAKVGEAVTWEFYRMHSISFSPTREMKEGLLIENSEPVEVNEDAWNASGSPPPTTDLFTYPQKKKKTYKIDGGTYDGEGEFSSGVIRQIPPTKVTYTLRFSKAGTYKYQCLVHTASMRGKINVTE